jgi:hypothetical protein
VITLLDRSCSRHRSVLLQSLEGRWADAAPAALAHLERCARCERELCVTALTLAGLRRLAAASRHAEPPSDGWALVRRRLQPPTPSRWIAAFGFGKAVVSVGMLVTVIAPMWVGVGGTHQQVIAETTGPARPAAVKVKAAPAPAVRLTVREPRPRLIRPGPPRAVAQPAPPPPSSSARTK